MDRSKTLHKWSFIIFIAGVANIIAFLVLDMGLGSDVISRYPLTLEYYPAFIATMFGVLIAIMLGELMLASKQEKRMEEMQKILRKELERMCILISPEKGNHLDTQVWDSMINSGDVPLMPTDLQDELFEIYAEARGLNIETTRERDAAEAYRRNPNGHTQDAHKDVSLRNRKKEHSLHGRIRKFLESGKLKGPNGS